MIVDLDRNRLELREPSTDPSLPAGGRLLAVARRYAGTDWIITSRDQHGTHVDYEDDKAGAEARLRELSPDPADRAETGR